MRERERERGGGRRESGRESARVEECAEERKLDNVRERESVCVREDR